MKDNEEKGRIIKTGEMMLIMSHYKYEYKTKA
jgi:hypothetical protein